MLSEYEPIAFRLPVTSDNILEQFSDGALFCALINVLATKQLGQELIPMNSIKLEKATIFHKMDNINKALEGAKTLGLTIVNVRAEAIVEEKEAAILGLLNQLARQRPGDKKTSSKQQPEKSRP